jgi:PAS domain S-box-containing protein
MDAPGAVINMKPIRTTRVGAVVTLGLLVAFGIAFFMWRQRRVDLQRVYTVGWASLPPLEVAGSDGDPTGLAVELVREAARRRNIRLRWVFQTVDPDNALRTGAVDLWPVVTITPERQKAFHISDPFLQTDHCLLVRGDSPYQKIQDLAGATIATANALIDGPALRRNFPHGHMSTGPSVRVLVENLCQGSADAAYMNEYSAVAALLDNTCNGTALRWIAVPQEQSRFGIAATFETGAVADALRVEIGSGKRWLAPILSQWGYMSWTVQSISALLNAQERELRLAAVATLLAVLLVAGIFQTARIRGERNRVQQAERALREDIENRKKVEEKLFETSSRLETLLSNSPLALVEWGQPPERRITRWMGNAAKLFGWRASEVLGKRLDEFGLIYPDDAEVVGTALDALNQGKSSVVRNRNYRKNGSVIHCEWYNSALMGESGQLIWGLSLALDVTARYQMEEALRASEEKYRNIFEAAPVGIFQSTTDGRFLSVNSRLAAMFRFNSAEEMVCSVENIGTELFVHPEQRQDLIRQAEQAGGYIESEVEYRRKDGSTFVCNYYTRVLRVENGRAFLEGFVEDITERKRAEEVLREAHDVLEHRVAERTAELSAANERLKELDRLKSLFVASMSHELRTPLNSIIGFTSLLRRGLSGPVNSEQQKQLGIVQTSASHLLGLINDLLDVSHIEAGKADLVCESFDFVEVVQEVVRTLQPMADSKRLPIVIRIYQQSIPMRGDRKRTVQILLNLASNALKFTQEGSVEIVAAASEDKLQVAVADTGIGIKQEHLGMLFEAFRQVDGSAKRVYEGTGLGLYLCRKLLTIVGGEIFVESKFGVGSRFTYWMPLELGGEGAAMHGTTKSTAD